MIKSDFNLHKFNDDLRKGIIKEDLDFSAMLVGSFEGAVSITAKYSPPIGEKRYVTLDSNLSIIEATDTDEWYYGVSPKMDNDMIIEAISSLRFRSLKELDSFVSEHGNLFMFHADQSKYLLDFARYIILSVASNFGITMEIPVPESLDIAALAKDYPSIIKLKEDSMVIRGCPTDELLKDMESMRFLRGEENRWCLSENGISLQEIYVDSKNISLLEGSVFYSGVLLKPVRFERLTDRYENNLVDSVILHFERSTYATVFALDNNFTMHPLLRNNNNSITKLLLYDDIVKKELIDSLDSSHSESETLSIINNYLSRSFNVNQIGISANVITEEGILLMGTRADEMIDNGALYPSVNGNAELADKNVSFYSVSVYEDYPTIDIRQDRIDFLGEISREAYAEIKLDLPKQEWHCYGILISGNRPEVQKDRSSYDSKSRRMHFNILFEQHTENSFLSVEQVRKNASEKFENKKLIGFQIQCYKNRFSYFLNCLHAFIDGITNKKDVVESVMILILFFVSLFQNNIEESWSNTITLILAVIILFSTLRHIVDLIIDLIKKHKNISRVKLYRGMTCKKKNEKLYRLVKNHYFHPAAYASLKFYVDNMLYSKFFK